ncbi:MAG: nuclear transport factor 2 family protein [Abditibacteriales bacterium]|nr:nuclear transport factor 2 family protein [Abditibacteriales bacterium]MDW8366857.1 nuclear transport factor 2 family protein [Abditibacteriales bacterium]
MRGRDYTCFQRRETEDVDWRHSQPNDIPWGGDRRVHEEVTQFFVALGSAIDVEAFEPREFIAQGDKVVVTGYEGMKVKSNGRVYGTHWAHLFTVGDGKIAGFYEYTDTAAIVAALRA